MNSKCHVSLVVFGLLTSLVCADALPRTPPPKVGEASALENGELEVVTSFPYAMPITKQIQKTVNGQTVTEEITALQWCTDSMTVKHVPDNYLVMTIGGEKLDEAAVKAMFATRRPVLVIDHGKRMDPAYAAVFDPQTPVVYLRHDSCFGPPGGGAIVAQGAPVVKAMPPPAAVPGGEPPTAAPSSEPPEVAKLPAHQATAVVADGDLVVTNYQHRQVPHWKTVWETQYVPTPDGQRAVKKAVPVAETIWVPEELTERFPISQCAAIGHDGQPRADVKLETLFARNTPIFVHPYEGVELDTRICPFLKPDVVIVRVPSTTGPMYAKKYYGQPLQFAMAEVNGDLVKIMKIVAETVVEKAEYTVTVNGRPETKIKEVARTVTKPVWEMSELSMYDGLDGLGNPVAADRLKTRLAKLVPVLICDGPEVDPDHLAVLKPNVMILATKRQEGFPAPAAASRQRDTRFRLVSQPQGEVPASPRFSSAPPMISTAQKAGNLLVVNRVMQKFVSETKIGRRKVGDTEEEFTYQVIHPVFMNLEEAVGDEDFRIVDLQGKELDLKTLPQRLAKKTAVLVAEWGQRVDPQYLVFYKPDTLVIYLKPSPHVFHGPAPTAPGAVPVAPGTST